ncbi:hypothetical protein KAR91_28655 [Candidatus Pacearchaeota archaeon]|nr:hypothetical protein [Candidatus Pacearchaeota archaeon]
MDIYSINNIPVAKAFFVAGKDVIIEMYDNAGALISLDTTVEFIGNTTSGSLIVSNIADTSLLAIGQVVEGVGIPQGAKITDKSVSTITLDALATISDTLVDFKSFTLCTQGQDDVEMYYWSFSNITTQPETYLAGHWKMRTSDDSYPEIRVDFTWGGWPDNIAELTRIATFPTDHTQSIPRVKGDNIDFIFDFQEDVTGWMFMFTLVDPNDTFELKKGSANVTGGSDLQISVEPTSTFSRVIAKVDKEETETFAGIDGNYELQYITDEDEQGTIPGVIVFKDELINKDWVIP